MIRFEFFKHGDGTCSVKCFHEQIGKIGWVACIKISTSIEEVYHYNPDTFNNVLNKEYYKDFLKLAGGNYDRILSDKSRKVQDRLPLVYGIVNSHLDKRFRGEGLGIGMYCCLLWNLWHTMEKQSFLIPNYAFEEDATSLDARRVWNSLAKVKGMQHIGPVFSGKSLSTSSFEDIKLTRRRGFMKEKPRNATKNDVYENLIREIVNLTLNEASDPLEIIDTTKIACCYSRSGRSHIVVLYDMTVLEEMLKDAFKENDFSESSTLTNYYIADIEERYKTHVVLSGIVFSKPSNNVGQSWNSFEVNTSAARPKSKMGPAAYEIAMYYASKMGGGLMSDRTSVSDQASKVWVKYKNERDNVEKKEFDDKESPKTEPKIDDSLHQKIDALNYSYSLEQKSSKLVSLEENHEKFVKFWEENGGEKSKLEYMLQKSFDALFDNVF